MVAEIDPWRTDTTEHLPRKVDMPPTNNPPSSTPAVRQRHDPDRVARRQRQLVQDVTTLRGLVRRYRRAAVLAIAAGEIKAVVTLAVTDQGGVAWWANLGWAAILLVGGGYLAEPHVRRLAELADPAGPARRVPADRTR